MNKVQKDYAEALAAKKAAQEAIDEAEVAFIRERGIINPDGSVPASLYMIDDENLFDEVCEEFGKLNGSLNDACNVAFEALVNAEDALIDWGLSLAPEGVRKTLEGHRKEYKCRTRLIDLAFRLDSRTVPKMLKGV